MYPLFSKSGFCFVFKPSITSIILSRHTTFVIKNIRSLFIRLPLGNMIKYEHEMKVIKAPLP